MSRLLLSAGSGLDEVIADPSDGYRAVKLSPGLDAMDYMAEGAELVASSNYSSVELLLPEGSDEMAALSALGALLSAAGVRARLHLGGRVLDMRPLQLLCDPPQRLVRASYLLYSGVPRDELEQAMGVGHKTLMNLVSQLRSWGLLVGRRGQARGTAWLKLLVSLWRLEGLV